MAATSSMDLAPTDSVTSSRAAFIMLERHDVASITWVLLCYCIAYCH